MSVATSSVRDVFSGVSARLGALAATLSDASSARVVTAATVVDELHDIADLTSSGLDRLVASRRPQATNMVPAVADALDGMSRLATRIEASPGLVTTTSTVDAIAGWAGLAAGATIALRRR